MDDNIYGPLAWEWLKEDPPLFLFLICISFIVIPKDDAMRLLF